MSWTVETARERLQAWLNAEMAVSTGQSYRIGARQLNRASLADIREQILFWRNEVARLERGSRPGARVMRVVPRDL
ncbi:DUF6148 family protein [Brevibacillus parabrevis]|uniref:Uncharacterized protein n=1 Tax=Brevibacillus parabrevis TaxID=54914 RepID=A0A4Y3PPZ5_BREPA|nr:DUF6148 family protein [Brevibacillus parabrevis]RNB94425.1 hypothetical protein EDM60_18735 [Brevibacillus parabrevis]GEB35297.1 hypothetical protein BPA01_48770 [Brevibacillus parabrevis]